MGAQYGFEHRGVMGDSGVGRRRWDAVRVLSRELFDLAAQVDGPVRLPA